MSVAAIICEYNPFHFGHKYQIEQVRKMLGDDVTVLSLMSGSTVQRGEVAVASKYERAKAAVIGGADLVLELPYPHCSSVAEHFAMSAVTILSRLHCVDYLVFGSECGDIAVLKKHLDRRFSNDFIAFLSDSRELLPELSYPQLVESCYRTLYGEDFPKGPNDILAVYYLKALSALHSQIVPITHLRRKGASATAARAKMMNGDFSDLPSEVQDCFSHIASLRHGERAILARLNDGANSVMANAAASAASYDSLVAALSQKNNTSARIRRDILQAYLGYDGNTIAPVFTTVLAMDEKGAALLHEIKRKTDIQIITKPADYVKYPEIYDAFTMNLRSDRLFALCSDRILPGNWSLRETPYVKK